MQLTVDWLTTISFLLNLGLAYLALYQFVNSKKEEENTKSKVKLWQKHAEGLKDGLIRVAMNPDRYSGKVDIAEAVGVSAQVATRLDESFVEERFYTEKEVRDKREQAEKERKELFARARSSGG